MFILISIFIILLIGISIVYYTKFVDKKSISNNSSKEYFLGDLPNLAVKTNRIQKGLNGVFYSTPGFQAGLTPRNSGGISFGANINNGPLPNNNFLAVEPNPIMQGSCDGLNSCSSKTNILENNLNDDPNQPIIYDRLMFANKQSRLRSRGDPIRGDLPIIPLNTGWFRPSVTPSIDLQEGAINVLAGENNETTKSLNNLMYGSLGGVKTHLYDGSGDLVKTTNDYYTTLNSGQQDVLVTAYP